MKHHIYFLFVLIFAVIALGAQESSEIEIPTLAVFELRVKDIDEATMLQYLDALSGAFYRTGRVTVIDRGRREEILGEIEFALSEAADDKERITAGKQLSASLILAGSIGAYDESRVVNLRLLETATGKIVGTADEMYDDDEALFKDVDDIATRLIRKAAPVRSAGSKRVSVLPPKPTEDRAESSGIQFFPFQLSIWSPLQLVPPSTRIIGARVTLAYSDNVSVLGVDAGIVGRVSENMTGVQANVINIAGSCLGVQTGIIGFVGDGFPLQANAIFNKAGTLVGAQIGIVNTAGKCVGTQIGVVNVAGLLHGVQIGIVNVVRYGDQAGFMPFVNIRF